MPKRLSDDINSIFFDSAEKLRRTVNDGSKSVAEIFNLSVSSAIVTIRPQNIGLSSFLPGPFEPIFNKTDNIIDMLKADLGIEKMSGKFYARFRKIRE